ncbi:MAG: hypothetical protein M1822_002836 [Bathelium mastoideum]|nr:MAG: hypothetical protein M1822_002836 [Bathelium mastoideum]
MLSAVPEVNYAKGTLDMVFVRSVCEVQCMLVGVQDAKSGGTIYVHEVGDVVVPLERMHDLLQVEMRSKTHVNRHMNGYIDKFSHEKQQNHDDVDKNLYANDKKTGYQVLPMAE